MEQVSTRAGPAAGGMDVKEFLAFLEFRPDEERWELIEGVAVMMAPPTLAHQRIAGNLSLVLNLHFRSKCLDLFAYGETGVRMLGVANFMPKPDVIVAPASAGYEVSSGDFQTVAEVLSPANRKREMALKLRRYWDNPLCRSILVIDSRRIRLELHTRGETVPVVFATQDAIIPLPAFDLTFSLADLYRGTPLDAARCP